MGVARSIEKRLEGLVEGFFVRVFKSRLQPVEVGRRILREMTENKTVSVNRIYTPNEFRVEMGSDDHRRFSQMEAGLQKEFSELVIDHAKENRWNLMGMPRITFEEDASLYKGRFRVEASLTADPDAGAPSMATRQPQPEEASFTRAIPVGSGAGRLKEEEAEFVVLGSDGGVKDRIRITEAPATIGRLSTNDVVLSDPNVSRRHAELRRAEGRWVLVDLGSTNGTTVNGKLAREHQLSDGDTLGFGTSELRFQIRGS